MPKYIKDFLELPTQVKVGGLVPHLAAGVADANASAPPHNDVVTPQLAACFDQALGLIKGAVPDSVSRHRK